MIKPKKKQLPHLTAAESTGCGRLRTTADAAAGKILKMKIKSGIRVPGYFIKQNGKEV